ncbi:PEP-CTERM sorting domain-containing protein [Candidatus Parcubacteria bacterium]|nr:PEP-CTERM sorting domain-containing protein [Candidatus Parcubacteria bacterium]
MLSRSFVLLLFFFSLFDWLFLVDEDTAFAATILSCQVDGQSDVLLTDAEGIFSARNNANNGVTITVDCFSEWWYLSFFPSKEEDELLLGLYPNAESFRIDPSTPGLDVFSSNYTGNQLGEFDILELSYAQDGNVLSFAANFTQFNQFNPVVTGEIRINSSPVPVPEPCTLLLFGTGLVGIATIRLKNSC